MFEFGFNFEEKFVTKARFCMPLCLSKKFNLYNHFSILLQFLYSRCNQVQRTQIQYSSSNCCHKANNSANSLKSSGQIMFYVQKVGSSTGSYGNFRQELISTSESLMVESWNLLIYQTILMAGRDF